MYIRVPLFQEFEIQRLFKDLSMTFEVPFHDKLFTNIYKLFNLILKQISKNIFDQLHLRNQVY